VEVWAHWYRRILIGKSRAQLRTNAPLIFSAFFLESLLDIQLLPCRSKDCRLSVVASLLENFSFAPIGFDLASATAVMIAANTQVGRQESSNLQIDAGVQRITGETLKNSFQDGLK
jgi:hypothetical protein